METAQTGGIALSRKLAFLSLLMFLIASFLPSLSSGGRWMFGYNILVWGWLGPFSLHFGWYANPFYLFAMRRALFTDKDSGGASLMAALVALTSLVPGSLKNIHNSLWTPIDAYGPGFVLWFLSIALLSVITNAVSSPGKWSPKQLFSSGPAFCSTLILIAFLGVVSIIAAVQRGTANEVSKKSFAGAVFLRNDFCGPEITAPQCRIPLNGALEIDAQATDEKVPLSLTSPRMFLAWGIPIVRKSGYDYYLRDPTDDLSVEAVKANGPPAAVLRIGRHDDVISGSLTSGDGARVAFDTYWKWHNGGRFCPELKLDPKPDEHPRKLVMASLEMPTVGALTFPGNGKDYFQEYPTVKRTAQNPRAEAENKADTNRYAQSDNECREGPQTELEPIVWGRPIPTGGVFRYPSRGLRQFCEADFVYLYTVTNNTLRIHKLTKPDYRPAWGAVLEVQADGIQDSVDFKVKQMHLINITEQEQTLHVVLGYRTAPPYEGFTGLQSFDVDIGAVRSAARSTPRTSP